MHERKIEWTESIHQKLQFGDIVFIDGRSSWNILGRAIRIVENGGKHPEDRFVPNHIGIVIETHNDINECKIIQSAFTGVKIKPLRLWAKHPKANIVIKRYRGAFEHWKRVRMERWLLKQDGHPYDWGQAFAILGRYFLLELIENPRLKYFIKRIWQNPWDSKIKFICSELVHLAYLYHVESLWSATTPGFVTPWDLYRSKKLRTIVKILNCSYSKTK